MEEGNNSVAHVDWLGLTLPAGIGARIESVRHFLQDALSVPDDAWLPRAGGWFGYQSRVDLGGLGLASFGGKAQKGTAHVELNATGCHGVSDWQYTASVLESLNAKITRLDLAHDDLHGRTLSIERFVRWYHDGEFTANGRPPKVNFVDDFGTGKGRTLYVGSRTAGKLFRGYEKGKQLGDPASPWVRAEVEWRAQGRHIPYDALIDTATYIAGAFPCLAYLSARQSKIKTHKTAAAITYNSMVSNTRQQSGKALNVMCQVHGGDLDAIFAEVVREGRPKRLEPFNDSVLPRYTGGKHGCSHPETSG